MGKIDDLYNLKGTARVTLSIKVDFFDDGNLDARDGMEHSIRFDIRDPNLSLSNGRKDAWGAGESFGYQVGRLAKQMSDYLTDFDGSVIDGFCNGANVFLDEEETHG